MKAMMDLDSRLVAPPVLPVGLGCACPIGDPVLAAVELVTEGFLLDARVEAAAIAAPVDGTAVTLPPVMGIWVNLISCGGSVVVSTSVATSIADPEAPECAEPEPEAVQIALVVPSREHPTIPVLHQAV